MRWAERWRRAVAMIGNGLLRRTPYRFAIVLYPKPVICWDYPDATTKWEQGWADPIGGVVKPPPNPRRIKHLF